MQSHFEFKSFEICLFFHVFFLSEIKCHERKGSNVEGNIVCNAKLSFCYFFLLKFSFL